MTNKPASARLGVAFAIGILFAGRFAVDAWFDRQRHGDIAWQQWLGLQILAHRHLPTALGPEAFAATGAPWVPQEWALSLGLALATGPAYIVLVAAALAAALGVLFFTALGAKRLGAATVPTALAVACVSLSMLESYGIRAQVFGWVGLAAVMYVMRCVPGRGKWWIVPIVMLWANAHASALLAPALLFLWTAGIAVRDRTWSLDLREHVLLTVAALTAVCATPLGIKLPVYAIELFHSPIRAAITEWQPSTLADSSFTLGALPFILASLLLGFDSSRRWSEALVFAAVAWLAISAARNTSVCAIVLAPAVAERLTKYLPERLRVNAIFSELPVRRLLYVSTVICAILSASFLANLYANERLPSAAIDRLASIPGTHRLYCEDFAWCSLGLQHPNLREFLDGRCDAFPIDTWRDYLAVYHAQRNAHGVLERRGVDAMLISKKYALAKALPRWRDWQLIFADETYLMYVRTGTTTALR